MIELTPAQARALAEIAEREGNVSLHQLAHAGVAEATDDVYVTPLGATHSLRIARDGSVGDMHETLVPES